MKTIAERRAEYELRTGCRVCAYRAYPAVGRGSVIHDWISHEEVEKRFDRASTISLYQKIMRVLGGFLWN